MKRVVLWTCEAIPEGIAEERPVLDALRAAGVEARVARWDAGEAPGAGDLVVIRSTWDYHRRLPEFLEAVARAEAAGAELANPGDVVRWNADKRYLGELAADGVPVVPTWFRGPAEPARLAEVLGEAGLEAGVVKPRVSASGFETFVARADRAEDAARWDRLVREREMMVQPLVASIHTRGEVSLLLVAGAPSHAVRKVPVAGEFRCQEEHGGVNHPHAPTAAERDVAARALAAADARAGGAPYLYARVDLVEHEGRPVLIELELIEPALYLGMDPGAADRLAAAILARAGA